MPHFKINIKEKVLIFGRSPFLKDFNIQKYLGKEYTTIGINWVDNIPFDYVAYVDKLNYNDLQINPQSTIITMNKNEVREPYELFNETRWCFTHDYILRWLKGKCKEVILIGCADFSDKGHYNGHTSRHPCETNINQSIQFIENEATNWYNIYKANPNGVLKLPIWSGVSSCNRFK